VIDERVATTQEISETLAAGKAVVALESTVIAQGLPWPDNIATARAMQAAVRDMGAVPATIAILDGLIRIGLDESELTRIAASSAHDPGCTAGTRAQQVEPPAPVGLAKANRRDLAAIVAAGRSAATTVSSTLWIARRFGLEPIVMATGGLGGVHRDASVTFDVSTDLDELAAADGAVVVCSGLKSILDVPASLEALESRGVLVVGYRTDVLPGFLAVSSGLPLEHGVDTPDEAAAVIRAHRTLRLPGAIILAQPVPAEHALEPAALQAALDQALEEAAVGRISGKPLTPFLLNSIRQATAGRGLRANCELLVANARLAAEVAIALAQGR
jgi:pseudouridine-5'-phosphate glycosidase